MAASRAFFRLDGTSVGLRIDTLQGPLRHLRRGTHTADEILDFRAVNEGIEALSRLHELTDELRNRQLPDFGQGLRDVLGHLLHRGGHRRNFRDLAVAHQADRGVGIKAQLHDELPRDEALHLQLRPETAFDQRFEELSMQLRHARPTSVIRPGSIWMKTGMRNSFSAVWNCSWMSVTEPTLHPLELDRGADVQAFHGALEVGHEGALLGQQLGPAQQQDPDDD